MKREQGLLLFLIFLFVSPSSFAQAWSGIIDPSRAVDWSKAGVPGGIPTNRTQCGSTIPAGASAATINSAIAACGANQFVLLAAGTYNLSTGIVWSNKSYVTLRGAGANQTFLVFSGTNSCAGRNGTICMESADVNYSLGPSNTANWTSGYAKGSTSITLDSVTNLAVGKPITLDQTDDTSDGGNIFVCATPAGTCSTNGDNGGFSRASRSQQQMVTVTSISGSGPYTVGITPGIYMPNWRASQAPGAWWATSPVFGDGLEYLSVDNTAADQNAVNPAIAIFNCLGCWVKGVRSINAGRSHVQMMQSNHITVQDSYFYGVYSSTSNAYGVEPFPSSDSLIQNNIFQAINAPVAINGSCAGCVQAYNFDVDDYYNNSGSFTWQQHGSDPHAAGNDTILVEGNQGAGADNDIIHGGHHFITEFRNAWNGHQPNNGVATTQNTVADTIRSYNRFFNVIGNVLGSPGYTATYSGVGITAEVFDIGNGDSTPNDANVARTLMRWGNYDVVTGAVRWCGNSSDPGWSTTCGSTSEVPSGIALYANPVPASTTLPPSFYLAAKPSWWPASKPWPAVGPDVTGGNLPGLGGHAFSNPAADCYANTMGGPTDGTGPVLTFGCFQASSAPLPQPPTNLTLTVQ